MPSKTVYKKIFTRDFLLTTVEMWVRPEANPVKTWTPETLPYSPYIVVEGVKGRTTTFYDPRGIAWLKDMLVRNIKDDASFLSRISKEYEVGYDTLKAMYTRKDALSREELAQFLAQAEGFWGWFEALWWVWELTPEEQKGIIVPSEILTLRENTQDIVPEIEHLARRTLRQLYPDLGDLIEVLTTGEITSGVFPSQSVLEERYRGYFFLNNALVVGKDRKYIEDAFQIQFEQYAIESRDSVKGQSAFKGIVRGRVKILYGPKEMHKVEEGDIIVSPMTMPDVLPAMKKAAAFVTDEGGIMCHAAIIAREMKKPCVIGTKYATEVFKDGDFVEVDAERGIVKILNHDSK